MRKAVGDRTCTGCNDLRAENERAATLRAETFKEAAEFVREVARHTGHRGIAAIAQNALVSAAEGLDDLALAIEAGNPRDLRAENKRLRAKVAAVEALHTEGTIDYYDGPAHRGCSEDGLTWPCPTRVALTDQGDTDD